MVDYFNCLQHGFGALSPFCPEFTNPQIELPPPIMGTYIRPPYVPPVIIETPTVPIVETPHTVPEPAAAVLLCASLLVALLVKRWRRTCLK